MKNFKQLCASFRQILAVGLLILGVSLSTSLPADAADLERYITPEGEDITAMVECLPPQLREGDLQRAIAESGKDYLERAFNLKENSSEYELTEAEKEYRACLTSKGMTPTAEKY